MKFSDVFPIFTLKNYESRHVLEICMDKEVAYLLSTKDAVKYSRMKFEKSLMEFRDINPAHGAGAYYGTDTCPLCAKFFTVRDGRSLCYDCPIYLKTGQHRCEGTPYDDEIVESRTIEEHIPALEHEIAFLKEIESEL